MIQSLRNVLGWEEEEREEKFADACELAVAVTVAENRSLWCGDWKGGGEAG